MAMQQTWAVVPNPDPEIRATVDHLAPTISHQLPTFFDKSMKSILATWPCTYSKWVRNSKLYAISQLFHTHMILSKLWEKRLQFGASSFISLNWRPCPIVYVNTLSQGSLFLSSIIWKTCSLFPSSIISKNNPNIVFMITYICLEWYYCNSQGNQWE